MSAERSDIHAAPLPSSGRRFAIGLLSLLHYAVLGCVLPLLPNLLRERFGLTWTELAAVLTALPLGLLPVGAIANGTARIGIDPKTSAATTYLLMAGLLMAGTSYLQRTPLQSLHVLELSGGLLAFFVLLCLALRWLPEIAGRLTGASNTAWRLWGAIGFILPAWLLESSMLPRFGVTVPALTLETTFEAAAWLSVVAVPIALLTPAASTTDEESASPTIQTRMSTRLVVGIAIAAVVSRMHVVTTAPFTAAVIDHYAITERLLARIVVVSGVFEVVALFGIGLALKVLGPRGTLLLAGIGWLMRCGLLAWTAQTPITSREALLSLVAAQALCGLSTASVFAALAASTNGFRTLTVSSTISRTSGLAGAAGILVMGVLADALLESTGPAAGLLQWLPKSFNIATHAVGLTGWAGVWWCSAVAPALLILIAVVLPMSVTREHAQ